MSATRILAQSVPCLLNAFPGWRQPVHVCLVADVGASGAVTARAAETTPGLAIALVGSDSGIYEITFPACRAIGAINIDVWPDDATDVTDGRKVNIEPDNTTAADGAEGTIRFHCARFDNTENDAVSPVSGSQIRAYFWADFG